MAVLIPIVAVLYVLGLVLLFQGQRLRRWSVETAESEAPPRGAATVATSRAPAVDEPRSPAARPSKTVRWSPADEEELGVTRRKFLNRGIVAGILFIAGALGGASLAFIWPPIKTGIGLGGKIKAGKLADILAKIDEKRAPFYVPEARAYVSRYPIGDVGAAKKAGYAAEIIPSLEKGFIVQSQKCPHLGCRVPWCSSSQWFECPCHGSKYNRVGERRDGPAPRGLSLIAAEVSGGTLSINTDLILPGMPNGTDTTGQRPEGPSCI